ncbi:amino acid adenylation domain-containing protein [Paenibacillus polysaccharolyticus]|uniref:non-ribosomal peptide synthetase n=1 Tax=Paenibacillus polysaccharolyticus TaxID=582692 RepID=UPI0020420191|nr:non-ribosomal peptide synthetase [Paenibacillus polysaccharolyticus]MCM3132973.1 amino acid adenylation domain-containing protein [Paenibacillus polysaccharolyticus]
MSYSNSRITNLVRINGKRVDLSQLEKEWRKHPAVTQCAIVAVKGKSADLRLVAFVSSTSRLDCRKLWSEINLPENSDHVVCIQISSFPLLPEGKIDKETLFSYAEKNAELLNWEAAIRSLPEIGKAAIVAEEILNEIEHAHIDDLIDIAYTKKEHSLPQGEVLEERANTGMSIGPLAIIHGGTPRYSSNEPINLADVLERAALNYPDHGIHYINNEGQNHFQSYAALFQQAKEVAAGLKKHGLKPENKVIFQLEEKKDFVLAFWACILGGFVPVPVTVPRSFTQSGTDLNTLSYIINTLEQPYIITNSNRFDDIKDLLANPGPELKLIKLEEMLQGNSAHDADHHRANPADLAIILFTSGSTGSPKGVLQTHETIISRERGTTLLNQFNAEDVSVNWMPLEHVGGIVMFHIKEMYLGCTQVQVQTNYILAEPLHWLDIIDQYKATLTWAPNFAYSLVSERLEQTVGRTWDLSAMKFILNAGEAITAKSCKLFLNKLQPFGLRSNAMFPTWGMSETCSGVIYSNSFDAEPLSGIRVLETDAVTGSFRMSNRMEDGITFTELGQPIPGVDVRIVNPKNELMHEGDIGRIQIRGLTTTPGYYNNPDENEKAFTPDGWFNTGDQGFIWKGCLTITGRLKDLLIINGVNYSNVELEGLVEEIDGIALSFTAVCAIRGQNSETDKIAVFFVSELEQREATLEQVRTIRKKLSDALGLKIDFIIPVTKNDIPKTNIGKIQRSKLAIQFLAGEFSAIQREVDVFEKNDRTIPNWFFEKKWSHVLSSASFPDFQGRSFWIIDDGDNNFLAHAISAQGGQVLLTSRQEESYPLSPLPTDILYISNSQFAGEKLSEAEIKSSQQKGLFGLLHLIQTLDRAKPEKIQLYVVTKNSQQCMNEPWLNYGDVPIQGFLKSAALENAWLSCCHVDFDCRDNEFSGLIEELKNISPQDEVVYRQHKRLLPQLVPMEIQYNDKQTVNLQAEGMYLITGGLGGIGTEVIKELAERMDLKFIVVGRSNLDDEMQHWESNTTGGQISLRLKAYKELEKNDVDFLYVHGDLTDVDFLKNAITQGKEKWNTSLAGALHLAGEGNLEEHWKNFEERLIHKTDTAIYERMFTAKIYGTLALHEALLHEPEAALILFSSVNGYFGASTFSAYSAANSFVDQFSIYRAHNGYPKTYCFAWSQWENLGMSRNNLATQATSSRGFLPLSRSQGIHSLLYGLTGNTPLIFIGLDRNHQDIRHGMSYNQSIEITPVIYYTSSEVADTASSRAIRDTLAEFTVEGYRLIELAEMPETIEGTIDYARLSFVQGDPQIVLEDEEPSSATESAIVHIFKEILQISQVNRNDSFFELGGHSLKATLVLSRIQQELNIKLPVQMIFQHPVVKQLANIIDQTRESHQSTEIHIPKLPVQRYYELSHAQKRVYILTEMDSQSNNYNILGTWEMHGVLKVDILKEAFQHLINRHQGLRATFVMVDETPVQQIAQKATLNYSYFDVSTMEETSRKNTIQEIVRREAEKSYDLEHGPLMQLTIVKMAPDQHMILVAQHHIISDGWSLGLLMKELGDIYETLLKGSVPEAVQAELEPTDYFAWHNRIVEQDQKSRKYWLAKLAGELPALELPLDFTRPVMQTYSGDTKLLTIPSELARLLEGTSQKHGVSLFMTLLAVFKVLLYKLTGTQDIIVGSPIAGRNHATENMIGMFVNTLALRTQIDSAESFTDLLEKVKQTALDGYEHQEYPFDRLVDELHPERDISRTPIFQVMMGMANLPLELDLKDLKIQEIIQEHTVAKFDLTLHVFERNEALLVYFEYNTDLFRLETIQRFMKYYKRLLEVFSSHPALKIREADFLDEAERSYLIQEVNNTRHSYPRDRSIQELFEEQAEANPEKIALCWNGQELTYADLNTRANIIANKLRQLEVQRDEVVGIMVERSFDAIAGILGIIKSGAAYMPIHPDYPPERITNMLEDSGVRVVLTLQGCESLTGKTAYCIPQGGLQLLEGDVNNPLSVNQATDLAYVLYTSGSTGQPKGVMVEQRNVIRLVRDNQSLPLDERDRILLTGALTFDASTFEIWGALLNGSTLYMVDDHVLLDAIELSHHLSDCSITVMWLSSPLFNQLAQDNPAMFLPLETLIVGGDVLSVSHINRVKQACPELTIINGYGPTENTTFTTTYPIMREYAQTVPIGKPISNTTVYILDPDGQLCPVGVHGELYTGGDGVARGYMNDPVRTAERFIHDSFAGKGRLYRTGDIVRLNGEGCVEYIGRTDNQVKIRGFRIETEEIRNAILANGLAKDAVVVVKSDLSGHKYLVAYAVPEDDDKTVGQFRNELQHILPEYMVPSLIVLLAQLPLLNNGKVDYKALPEPDRVEDTGEKNDTAPTNDIEKDIVEVYQQVMGLPKVGLMDSFFDLGGDSLLSIKVVSKLRDRGYKVDPKSIFMFSTPRSLAEKIAANGEPVEVGQRGPKDYLIDLNSKANQGKRLILAPPAGGTVMGYIHLAQQLDYPVYGLQSPGLYEDEVPQYLSYEELISCFLESINDTYNPKTDYLGGHSVGGHIAFGMCQELIRQGRPPKGLIILDTTPSLELVKDSDDGEDVSEEELKLMLLVLGMGNMVGLPNDQIKALGYEKAKQAIIEAAKQDELVQDFMTADYLNKYLQIQLHNVMMSRVLELEATKLSIPIIVMKTTDHPDEIVERFDAWNNYSSGGVRFIDVPGNHVTMMRQPHVMQLALLIDEATKEVSIY